MLVGYHAIEIGRGEQRLDGAEQDEIIGADQFVHGAMEPVADKPRKPKIAALRHRHTRLCGATEIAGAGHACDGHVKGQCSKDRARQPRR